MTATIVVVGDALLDIDIETSAERLSPDGPVPILDQQAYAERAGGAALSAALLVTDENVTVHLLTPLADDQDGRRLRSLIDGRIRLHGLPTTSATSVKTRLRCRGVTVTRVDRGDACADGIEVDSAALALIDTADAVLVSDYGRGTSENAAIRAAVEGRARTVPLVWDPHPRGAEPVPGTWLVTPNLGEARRLAGGTSDAVAAAGRLASALCARWQARAVAVTLAAEGAVLADGATVRAYPARPVAAQDSCGAGDCFAARATSALCNGRLLGEAVESAVAAATGYVARSGSVSSASTADGDWQEVVARVRARGGTVVATGGCFDLVHAGHVATLRAARRLGDALVVCLNSDRSVRELKGEGRPLQNERDRRAVLEALRAVDAVVVFDEPTPDRILAELQPDIWAKGGDYSASELPETAVLRDWGGEVVIVPYVAGRSTSRLVARARS